MVIMMCKPFFEVFCLIFDCNTEGDIFIFIRCRSWPYTLHRVRIIHAVNQTGIKMKLTIDDEWAGFGVQSEAGLMLLSLPNKLDDFSSDGKVMSDLMSNPEGVKRRISSKNATPIAMRHRMLSCCT